MSIFDLRQLIIDHPHFSLQFSMAYFKKMVWA